MIDQGAVVLGKCNMGEFALSPDESTGSVFGIVRNPYDLDHTTAGHLVTMPFSDLHTAVCSHISFKYVGLKLNLSQIDWSHDKEVYAQAQVVGPQQLWLPTWHC